MEEDKVNFTDFELFLDGVADLMFNRLAEMQPEAIELFISIAADIRKGLYKALAKTGRNYTPEKLEGPLNVALIQFGISWEKLNREREKHFNEFMTSKRQDKATELMNRHKKWGLDAVMINLEPTWAADPEETEGDKTP